MFNLNTIIIGTVTLAIVTAYAIFSHTLDKNQKLTHDIAIVKEVAKKQIGLTEFNATRDNVDVSAIQPIPKVDITKLDNGVYNVQL
jgi:hypothetical protein